MHTTQVRPYNEPYSIWKARRTAQNKLIKAYLRGSNIVTEDEKHTPYVNPSRKRKVYFNRPSMPSYYDITSKEHRQLLKTRNKQQEIKYEYARKQAVLRSVRNEG